jgi:hypothetical protein
MIVNQATIESGNESGGSCPAWRVVDADKAKALSDKKAEPSLEDPDAGTSLVVPTAENIGQLRQSHAPKRASLTGWRSRTRSGWCSAAIASTW